MTKRVVYSVHASSWEGIPNWDVLRYDIGDSPDDFEGPTIVWSVFSKEEADKACQAFEHGWCLDCYSNPCTCKEV